MNLVTVADVGKGVPKLDVSNKRGRLTDLIKKYTLKN